MLLFKSFLEFLNHNSGAFTVIFSALLTIVTAIYVFLSWKLVKETKKMREEQIKPKVLIRLQPNEIWPNFFYLIIENTGLGVAKDIKFEIERDFELFKGSFLSDLGMVKNGIKYLVPRQKLQFFFTDIRDDFAEKKNTVIPIRIFYQDNFGNKYSEFFLIDFSPYIGLSWIGRPPIYNISKHLENINKEIEKFRRLYEQVKKQK